jgi:hypothetical protein
VQLRPATAGEGPRLLRHRVARVGPPQQPGRRWGGRGRHQRAGVPPAGEDRAPEGRELLRVEQLKAGQRYFVYVTNAPGLYRYEMNNIVEVTEHDRQTPLIRFVQKGKGVVSFTGEKLYEVQVIAAVEKALSALRGRYHFIAAVAELVDGTTPDWCSSSSSTTRSPTTPVRRWWTASTRRWGTRTTNTSPSGSRCATRPHDPGRAIRRVRQLPPPHGGDGPAG